MKCVDCETILIELSCGRQGFEGAEAALAHAENCPRCAARLEEGRWLTLQLRALAEITREAEASSRVEAALLKAFRTGKPEAVYRPAPRLRNRWALAAAAVVVLFAVGIAVSLRPGRAPVQSAEAVRAPVTARGTPDQAERQEVFTAPVRRPARPAAVRTAQTAVEVAEQVTEFIPLVYDAGFLDDGAQIVRVSMPRASLGFFGLPVDEDRAMEMVKADVLLGHDGVAHAIRFVRYE